MSEFIKPPRRAFTTKLKDERPDGRFLFHHKDISSHYIVVLSTNEIEVYASTAWVSKRWVTYHIAVYSNFRSQGKLRAIPALQVHDIFVFHFQNHLKGPKGCLIMITCFIVRNSIFLKFFIILLSACLVTDCQLRMIQVVSMNTEMGSSLDAIEMQL